VKALLRVLVVEDGVEYVEGFERLASARGLGIAFSRARDLESALAALAALAPHGPDALFLDVVFDRSPEDRLAGDAEALVARFGGDRARAVRHLATHQGFYILDAIGPRLPGIPVVLAYDFAAEPQRLEALRVRVSGLTGLPDGTSLTAALDLLLRSPGTRTA
jgi:CheY-like chemotaxis protein